MKTRFLGRTGLEVSELCLGTMGFGSRTDESTALRILDRFADAGGTFIDTANVYDEGRSEEIVGRWLARRDRDAFVVATKVYGERAPGDRPRGTGRKHVLAEIEQSLRRLQTDFVDVYYAHVFDDGTPFEETLSVFDSLVVAGRTRFVGASNYAGWQLTKSLELARHRGWEPFAALQALYNLLDRGTELELLPACRHEGVGVVTWSPLAAGLLSGRYGRTSSGPSAGGRISQADWAARDSTRTWSVIEALGQVAAETGRTAAQVALCWLLGTPGVTASIVGARTELQLADNLGGTGWQLTPEQSDRLRVAGDEKPPYPYSLLSLPQFSRRSA